MVRKSTIDQLESRAEDNPTALVDDTPLIQTLATDSDPQARSAAAKAFESLAEVNPTAAAELYEVPLQLLDDLPTTRENASAGLAAVAEAEPELYMFRVDELAKYVVTHDQYDDATLYGPLAALAELAVEYPADVVPYFDDIVGILQSRSVSTIDSYEASLVRLEALTALFRLAESVPIEFSESELKVLSDYAGTRSPNIWERITALLALANVSSVHTMAATYVSDNGVELFKEEHNKGHAYATTAAGIAFQHNPDAFSAAYDKRLVEQLQSDDPDRRAEAIHAYVKIVESDPSVLSHPTDVKAAFETTTVKLNGVQNQEAMLSVLIESIERVHNV